MTSSEKERMVRMAQVNKDREKRDFLKGLANATARILEDYDNDEISWSDVRDELEDLKVELDAEDNGWYVRRWMRINLKGN